MTATHGEGAYGNAVGVTTPTEHKLAQAGEIVKSAGNLIRPGLFWGGTATIITGKANMSYDVAAFTCVSTRGASSGAIKWANDGVYNAVTTAAPGSNSRIDVIIGWHREFALDGTNSDPVIIVVQGTAAAVPVAPSLAAYPGYIELGRAVVGAGITATTSATITQTAQFTAAAGGVIPFRNTTERDAGTYTEGQPGWMIDSKQSIIYNSSAWVTAIDDTGWASPTLLNSWSNLGSGYVAARYKRRAGVVHVQGTITGGTATDGTVLFNLPAGFRPSAAMQLAVAAGSVSGVGRVEVQANGNVVAKTVTAPVSLQMSFPAEA